MTKAKATSTNDSSDPDIQVLKEGQCKTLTYQIGTDDDGAILFRIFSNTGGGFFSNEWVPFSGIQAAFEKWPTDSPITSMALRPLFRGKSVNTPGFLVSVLCAEGLLEPLQDRQRVHRACDPSRFLASMDALRKDAGIRTSNKTAAKPKAKTPASAKAKAAPKKTSSKTR